MLFAAKTESSRQLAAQRAGGDRRVNLKEKANQEARVEAYKADPSRDEYDVKKQVTLTGCCFVCACVFLCWRANHAARFPETPTETHSCSAVELAGDIS